MDYSKVKKCIREYLENNDERISDRAEARVIRMSQKGYLAMMEHHTLTVKKLEEIAEKLNKPVSYFFVSDEDINSKLYKNDEESQEPNNHDPGFNPCNNPACKSQIDSLRKAVESMEKTINTQDELLEMYRDKKKAAS